MKEDREKLEESECVCECNSLPLLNPREFTDCRWEGFDHRVRWRDTEAAEKRGGRDGSGGVKKEKRRMT